MGYIGMRHTLVASSLEVRKSGIVSATEDTGLGLFAGVDFPVPGEPVTYFEKETHYTCEEQLQRNVNNLQHVVKGPNGWHDQTHVVANFIEDPTDPNGTWVPKQGAPGLLKD